MMLLVNGTFLWHLITADVFNLRHQFYKSVTLELATWGIFGTKQSIGSENITPDCLQNQPEDMGVSCHKSAGVYTKTISRQ